VEASIDEELYFLFFIVNGLRPSFGGGWYGFWGFENV
jgi:hypothetical protein